MENELLEYGLSKKEIETYISCLKVGESSVNRISKVSNINRSTQYDILESLAKKGIAFSFKKDKKIFYSVVDPKKLIELLDEKKKIVKKIIPKLEKIQNKVSNKPHVEMYEGKIGLIQASNLMLNSKEILAYGSNGQFNKIFEMFQSNFAEKRIENKIFLKVITEEDIPRHMLKSKIAKYTKIKKLKELKKSNVTKFIYDDQILDLIYGEEPIAIVTKSQEYAEFQRIIFLQLWNNNEEDVATLYKHHLDIN
jgi:sugar-specific transcriptional regulator TrmB